MHVLSLLERTVNGILEPLGVRVVRRGPPPTIGGRRLSDEAVIAQARRQGISAGEFIENLFGKKGRAEAIIQRMRDKGALSKKVSTVCEIGPGSGLYIKHVMDHAPVKRYEIYEIVPSRSEHLAREFSVVMQPTDGETLRATSSRSMDLVQAHGVFVTLDFLTSCSYFREMARVTAPGGYLVFDIISEDCLDDAGVDSWLNTPLRYPSLHSRDYVIRFFSKRGFSVVDEFVTPLLVHGSSRYLILRWQGVENEGRGSQSTESEAI
ncbi:MAG: methyltransferase domain-containing protein [Pyrinomonadaceae bacterium]